jgi:hypothetical protein
MSALEVKRHHPHLKVMSAFDQRGHFIAPPKARRVLFVTALNSSVSRIWEEIVFGFRFILVAAVIVIGLDITAAADRGIPKFDITATCGGSGQVEVSATCIQDERAAHKHLVKLWPKFKQSQASRCIKILRTKGTSNYVELLTCLQTPD